MNRIAAVTRTLLKDCQSIKVRTKTKPSTLILRTWKRWFDTDQPEEEEMPDGYNQSLDIFRKLLMIRAWCPDRIIPQARKYIASSLGKFSHNFSSNQTSRFDLAI